jgi:cobalamin biosynthesis protein CobD/CbiB
MKKFLGEVLDQFDEEPEKQWFQHPVIVFGAVIILIVGVLFHIMHWPFSRFLILLGIALMMVRSSIFFFTKKRKLTEWLYFLSRMNLSVAIIMTFLYPMSEHRYMSISLAAFGLCYMILVLTQPKQDKSSSKQENIEDDY